VVLLVISSSCAKLGFVWRNSYPFPGVLCRCEGGSLKGGKVAAPYLSLVSATVPPVVWLNQAVTPDTTTRWKTQDWEMTDQITGLERDRIGRKVVGWQWLFSRSSSDDVVSPAMLFASSFSSDAFSASVMHHIVCLFRVLYTGREGYGVIYVNYNHISWSFFYLTTL